MAQYTLKVQVEKAWVEKFYTTGMKLCVSHGVVDKNSSRKDPIFNVVATTHDVAPTIGLSWKDTYHIGAGNQSFSDGDFIECMTDINEIHFKQSVELTKDFMFQPAKPNDKLKDRQFAFKSGTIASAIIYKTVSEHDENEIKAPIYVSNDGPNPPGYSLLMPKLVVRVFFMRQYEAAMMFDEAHAVAIEVDFAARTEATVKYDAEGLWTLEA